MNKQKNFESVVQLVAGFANSATAVSLISNFPEITSIIPYISTTVQVLLTGIGNEIIDRTFSNREKEKISITFLTAIKRIKERQEKGETLRNDSFFQSTIDDYSSAAKILEAAFIESRNEFENKKLIYLGNLTANLLFANEHDYNRCLYFIKIAENLNYRQLCYIKLLKNKALYNIDSQIDSKKTSYKIMTIDQRYELYEMVIKCILKGPTEFKPELALPIERYNTDWVGSQLYELMNLDRIPEDDMKIIK